MEFYRETLKSHFEARKEVNKNYSLRAFARDLDIDPSTLSKILIGKRSFPITQFEKVKSKLQLEDRVAKKFVESLIECKNKNKNKGKVIEPPNRKEINPELYTKIISEWEHYAVLNLFKLDIYTDSEEWISKRLGIEEERVAEVLDNLFLSRLITYDKNEKLIRTHQNLDAPGRNTITKSLQLAHQEELALASKALNEIEPLLRHFFSATFTTNIKNIEKAKKLIEKFTYEFMDAMEKGERQEVYQLCLQFFPLTKVTLNQEERE